LAEGCLMVRTCHQDNCPVGIATQRPDLRAKFTGTLDMVVHYLEYVAQEVREVLASLGLRRLDDAVGRVGLLTQRRTGDPRADSLDLAPLLATGAEDGPEGSGEPQRGARVNQAAPATRFVASDPVQRPRSELGDRGHDEAWPGLRDGDLVHLQYLIAHTHRAGGPRLGVAVGKAFGSRPPAGRARVELEGTAGQSFGAFLAPGIDLRIAGPCHGYLRHGEGGA